MKKRKMMELLFFSIIFIIEFILFLIGIIKQSSDNYYNNLFMLFMNIYIVYIGLIYLVNAYLNSKDVEEIISESLENNISLEEISIRSCKNVKEVKKIILKNDRLRNMYEQMMSDHK